MTVSRFLLDYLSRTSISQRELARRVGVANTSVGRYLDGQEPTLSVAVAIADALEVSLDELAGRTVPKPKVPPEVLELLVELEQTIQRMSRALGGEDDGDTTQGAA